MAKAPNFFTPEQQAWMKAHPEYARTSHVRGRFTNKGTLRPDGTFLSQDKSPVLHGNGHFGVGVPVRKGRR